MYMFVSNDLCIRWFDTAATRIWTNKQTQRRRRRQRSQTKTLCAKKQFHLYIPSYNTYTYEYVGKVSLTITLVLVTSFVLYARALLCCMFAGSYLQPFCMWTNISTYECGVGGGGGGGVVLMVEYIVCVVVMKSFLSVFLYTYTEHMFACGEYKSSAPRIEGNELLAASNHTAALSSTS